MRDDVEMKIVIYVDGKKYHETSNLVREYQIDDVAAACAVQLDDYDPFDFED